ncbi:MAG: hypothetical protein QM535_01070 [Limnohabitans sp.]|nr:hypothetical protein [Limnohabitans sp.]
MKEYVIAIGVFSGVFLLFFSSLIISRTLLNDYLIYSTVLIVGLVVSVIYIFYNKQKIIDTNEFIYIPIRSTLGLGSISVFLFLWINFFLREKRIQIIQLPVKEYYLKKINSGGRYSNKVSIRSGFVVEYYKLNKDIVLDSHMNDSIAISIKFIEIEKSKGFFGIDIIEKMNLKY